MRQAKSVAGGDNRDGTRYEQSFLSEKQQRRQHKDTHAHARQRHIMAKLLVIAGVLALLSATAVRAATVNCQPVNGNDLIRKCGKQYFDLASIKGADGKSLLTAKDTTNGYMYYVQFTNNGVPSKLPNCTLQDSSVLGAQVRLDGQGCYSLAKANLINWAYDNSTNDLTITATGGTNGRSMSIKAQCQFGAKYTNMQETGESGLTYNFNINMPSKHCTNSPPHGPSHNGKKKTDGGAIVLGVFFGVLLGYFVLGAVYLGGAQGRRGVEMIPNREFWASLPGLVQDGFYFTTAKLKGTASRGNYAQI
ncbi:hypothetical protein PTSG_07762 [Salpingoeca rosetta]|uniref:Autophagy-related protein 27 n=1 Tax=Salpingoeca rosetta (strain ATCC 50818 / BSB-021) TaxID=946362 RepID=F2UG95_SALR5|nr:uncharacterized protein PTSG_07762 [Salpingoeca rosetta]EGD75645.1 hypothetical protein PTSG_07762 [Salpingoeca rosetta]|eukprot:XP_004991566.1 hypothetical protein PTSG_07762 [Salpingoeca rosetta]